MADGIWGPEPRIYKECAFAALVWTVQQQRGLRVQGLQVLDGDLRAST